MIVWMAYAALDKLLLMLRWIVMVTILWIPSDKLVSYVESSELCIGVL